MISRESLGKRIDAALGRVPCDLVIRGVRYLDVFSCAWRKGDISIADGVIVGVEPGLKGRRTIDGRKRVLVPGFIDAHVHVESSLTVPENFERTVLPHGTTTAICDPHELTNVLGMPGLRYFLDAAEGLSLDLRVMLSSCVPATHLETNGGGNIRAEQLAAVAAHPKALGLAEMMNVPGVLMKDEGVLAKLEAFSARPIDGHCPLLTGKELSAYAATGVSSCHESSSYKEAAEKLSKGISCWIREGSVAKDLDALVPLLTLATSTSIGFCTDDRNPLDIAEEGHIDYLIRKAIKRGVAPEVAYRAASWSVARHYGLRDRGAIAPGYAGDLVLLENARSCAVKTVFKSGVPVSDLRDPVATAAQMDNSIRASVPEARDLEGPSGRVRVIGARAGRILTDALVMNHDDPGVARLSVLERYGHGSRPSNGYVYGFGKKFRGAIASSVGHDSHNLISVGDSASDMRVAMAELARSGGGFCVVHDGDVKASLPLPIGGLMTRESPTKIIGGLKKLRQATRAMGCELPEPFLQLAFLSLPVIPSLKLTDKGLVDVEKFQFVDVKV